MLKDSSFQERFALIEEFMPKLIEEVRKDVRNDHLRHDHAFTKKYLSGPFQKAEPQELASAYVAAIRDGSDPIAEFLTHRWLLKHTDLYDFFAEKLSQINPDFSKIETITPSMAHAILEEASGRFGQANSYIFSVLNAVVFPKDIFAELREKARHELKQKAENAQAQEALDTVEKIKKEYELRLQRLTDKFEKKFSGMERKYIDDTTALKKRISELQKKTATV